MPRKLRAPSRQPAVGVLALQRRLRTAARILGDPGAGGSRRLLSIVVLRAELAWGLVQVWWQGGTVTVGGLRFSLRSPAIPWHQRSARLYREHEREELAAMRAYLRPELPVVELGGGIGAVACLTHLRLDPPRRHVVVEANPDLIPALTENRDRNECSFNIIHAAVAYGGEAVTLYCHPRCTESSLVAETGRQVRVPAVSLREIVERQGYQVCNLVCDIEGGEAALVEREADVLAARVAVLLLETHPALLGEGEVVRLHRRLSRRGFRLARHVRQPLTRILVYLNPALAATSQHQPAVV